LATPVVNFEAIRRGCIEALAFSFGLRKPARQAMCVKADCGLDE
jgi:hypothetical protein